MSTANIVSIIPVFGEGVGSSIGEIAFAEAGGAAIPNAIQVTFKVRNGEAVYQYDDPEAVAGIMAGEDPAQYSGARIA
jgi:hypothetical protein